MKQLILLFIAQLFLFPLYTVAQTCEISADKKAVIEALLCGQYAQEQEYHFSGPDCINKSAKQRAEDTAAQLMVLRACGHADVAAELKKATIIAFRFMKTLSVCTNQIIDFESVFETAEFTVKRKAGAGLLCTSSLRGIITQRLPVFRNMITMSKDPNLNSDIYKALKIRVDQDGNITEE